MLKPMLASLEEAPLADPAFVYEPKYDGIRVIAEIAVGGRTRLWSRLGNEKTTQFPEVAAALERWGRRLPEPVVLDGELVALDGQGQPTGFQQLQGRIHVAAAETTLAGARVAFIAFDVLRAAGHDLRERPLHERRDVLEQLIAAGRPRKDTTLRISEQVRGDGRALYTRALASGWEGLIAKHIDSKYKSGKRTPDWRKLKIVHEQEFVIGGWTEPRNARAWFGALLLGVYERDALVYVGHTGTGFDQRELERVMALLERRATTTCPFRDRPKTNERPHWVTPSLVAQIKFTEWTTDAKLRHPVYLGLRDDKAARDVHREPSGRLHASVRARLATPGAASSSDEPPVTAESNMKAAATGKSRSKKAAAAGPRAAKAGAAASPTSKSTTSKSRASKSRASKPPALELPTASDIAALVRTLRALEDDRQDATLDLGGGRQLAITNLHKPFWPAKKLTKGDLFRYYAQVAPVLLPVIADRPLVMKRFPNGVGGKPFYQHRSPDVPTGVRVAPVPSSDGPRPHIIGGDLLTLLYTTQLAAISQDPWFSRIQSPTIADCVALDLDPSDGVAFRQVLEVARAIHDELDSIGAAAFAKTSGASGLHVFIPLPPDTPYEAGLLFCQIIATVVTHKHPRIATVERSVAARGKRVYVDYLQNIMGKTLASAYSVRANDFAGVSTPLTWDEVHGDIDREDFTLTTVPKRLATVGDLWGGLRTAAGVDLGRAAKYGL